VVGRLKLPPLRYGVVACPLDGLTADVGRDRGTNGLKAADSLTAGLRDPAATDGRAEREPDPPALGVIGEVGLVVSTGLWLAVPVAGAVVRSEVVRGAVLAAPADRRATAW
jgi:hypothetical protein